MSPHTSSMKNTDVKFVGEGEKSRARRGSIDSGTRRISSKQEVDLNKSIDKTSLRSRGKKHSLNKSTRSRENLKQKTEKSEFAKEKEKAVVPTKLGAKLEDDQSLASLSESDDDSISDSEAYVGMD